MAGLVVLMDILGTLKAGGTLSLRGFHSTSYGIIAGMVACYALGEALSGAFRNRRGLVTIGLAALSLVGLSTSAASIIATSIGLVTVSLLSRKPFLLVTVLLTSLSLLLLPKQQLKRIFFPDKEDVMIATMSGRTAMWENFIPLIKEKPILGYGMSVAARYYGSSYNVNCHNSWLAAVLSTGFIGGTALAFGVVAFFWGSFRAFQVSKAGALGCIGAFSVALVNSFTFAFVGEDWCVPSFAFVAFWSLQCLFVRSGERRTRQTRRSLSVGRVSLPVRSIS